MSLDSSREDLSDLLIGATDRGTPRTHTPRAISPVPEREFRRDTLQELPEDQEYNIKLEEPNGWETKGVEGQDGGKNLGGNTPEFHDVQHPQPEAQAREEGKWHNFRSSSSEPEDREGPTEDRSFGSNGKDLSARPTGETKRENRRAHASKARSPFRERESRRTIRQEPLKYLNYDIKMEEPNGWETRGVEGLSGAKRPIGDTQKTHGLQHPPPETRELVKGSM